MSLTLTNFKFLIENDSNPLIAYNNIGKITYLNKSAELLVGFCSPRELYELAITHAPKNFGAKTTHIDLVYKAFKFYAINVLYESEDEISIHLYNKPMDLQKEIILKGYTPTDINILLEVNIELFRIKYNNKLTLFADCDLPKIQINQNSFSVLLRKIFEQCMDANRVDIELKIKIGETININRKKYTILILQIKTDIRNKNEDKAIEKLASQNYINCFLPENAFILEIPYIKN
jgi:hypothetical protein